MAIYRTIAMTFWTDSKVADDFSPEERYMYLYLLTNPHTNLCGCYEVSFTQIAFETGYSAAKVKSLIQSLASEHDVIRYSEQTKEVLILNWHKYSWTSSQKFRRPLEAELNRIKDRRFAEYLLAIFNGESLCMDTVSAVDGYPMDTRCIDTSCTDTSVSVSVSVTDTVSDTDTDNDDIKDKVKEIIDYFNEQTGKSYTYRNQETIKMIRARLREKFTVDDFKTVIYKKTKEWVGTEYEKFIRPQTLFGSKFESYLNQSGEITAGKKGHDTLEEWVNG